MKRTGGGTAAGANGIESIVPEENTLGIVVGRAGRAVVGTARRLTRPGSPHRASLGTTFLGFGAAVVVGLRSVYGLTEFLGSWGDYPQPVIALLAWIVLLTSFAAVIVIERVVGDRLPAWGFGIFLAGLGAAVALDVTATWGFGDLGGHATAAAVAGMGMLLIVTLRGRAEVITATAVLAIVLIAAVFLGTPVTAANWPDQVYLIAGTVLPAVIGIAIVEGFREMVQTELDRSLVQSTVSAPRFAVGMLASEELARLDLAAEELLDGVAEGRTNLPLSPRSASVAASLATELRLHLIEGRRETWLYHAVSESELLGRAVTLIDKSGLAGLLDAAQRDGLLAATWLLVNDTTKATARSLTIEIGPVVGGASTIEGKISVPIVLTSSGVPRNRVDPSIWDALGRVGRYSDSTQDSSLRVDIDCLVDNPAEH
ncbi:hypothetical protein [Schumannella sp. 10F1B-5-1]|uniref:hypothetical protein n=1 Tax=Schumannella sp. 10F1B-5-1 TaxID=2590780 RepID=UPI0011312223|nr:hypothetical protein [Schumannella sp. 10F1B-5-1]TPW70640.1 hypothetical protein FJ658_10880 [Schumannella sp. 10F1B-5-1]